MVPWLFNLGGDAFVALAPMPSGQSGFSSPYFAFPLWTDGTQVLRENSWFHCRQSGVRP